MTRRLTGFAAATMGLTSLVALPQSASATPPSLACRQPVGRVVTCASYAPGETAFVVPAGVRSVQVRLVGAAGGAGQFGWSTPTDDELESVENDEATAGGLGADLQGTLSVKAGDQLYLFVGGRGQDGGFDPGTEHTGLGGVNGGGDAGGLQNGMYRGGGGGGASDVRIGTDGVYDRVMVAAGGGGAGAGNIEPFEGGDHDRAATLNGRPDPCAGGSGHSRRAGVGNIDGLPGGYGVGGAGSPEFDNWRHAGGGGGGGYGGGGGGAMTYSGAGCGGGGGSSFFNHRRYGVRGTSSTLWTTTAPPSVTLTYLAPRT